MKTIICGILISVSTLMLRAQTYGSLTNHVWIGNRGLCFSITDKVAENGQAVQSFDTEVLADARLFWVLDNPTTNHASVHSQGLQRTFSLLLFDSAGHEVPLTEYGKMMNRGPVSLAESGDIHFIGLEPGAVDVRDFPALTNLFLFSKPGDYIFEARYWHIEIGSGLQWKLSDPVRLKVVKRPDKTGE